MPGPSQPACSKGFRQTLPAPDAGPVQGRLLARKMDLPASPGDSKSRADRPHPHQLQPYLCSWLFQLHSGPLCSLGCREQSPLPSLVASISPLALFLLRIILQGCGKASAPMRMACPKSAASTKHRELLPCCLVPGMRTTTDHIQSATCRMTSEVPATAARGQPRQPPSQQLRL